MIVRRREGLENISVYAEICVLRIRFILVGLVQIRFHKNKSSMFFSSNISTLNMIFISKECFKNYELNQ